MPPSAFIMVNLLLRECRCETITIAALVYITSMKLKWKTTPILATYTPQVQWIWKCKSQDRLWVQRLQNPQHADHRHISVIHNRSWHWPFIHKRWGGGWLQGIMLGCCRRVTGRYQMEVKHSFMVMEKHIVYLGYCAQGHHFRWKCGAARNLHKCKFAVQLATSRINGGLLSYYRTAHFQFWFLSFVYIWTVLFCCSWLVSSESTTRRNISMQSLISFKQRKLICCEWKYTFNYYFSVNYIRAYLSVLAKHCINSHWHSYSCHHAYQLQAGF